MNPDVLSSNFFSILDLEENDVLLDVTALDNDCNDPVQTDVSECDTQNSSVRRNNACTYFNATGILDYLNIHVYCAENKERVDNHVRHLERLNLVTNDDILLNTAMDTDYNDVCFNVQHVDNFSYIDVTKTFFKSFRFMQYLDILHYVNENVNGTNVPFDSINDEGNTCCNIMSDFRRRNKDSLICCHLNINGLRSKFLDITDLMTKGLIDIFFLSETKLDASVPSAQFSLDEYRSMRPDRNLNCGGIMGFVRHTM